MFFYKGDFMKAVVLYSTWFMMAVAIMLAGCSSISTLEPGAEHVRVGRGPVPKGCQLRGNVSSSSEYIPLSSHKSVMEGQLNSLKNQALKLGANLVIVTGHQTDYYSDIIVSTAEINRGIDTHAMTGQAYLCH